LGEEADVRVMKMIGNIFFLFVVEIVSPVGFVKLKHGFVQVDRPD
jgi:hypothetical protein